MYVSPISVRFHKQRTVAVQARIKQLYPAEIYEIFTIFDIIYLFQDTLLIISLYGILETDSQRVVNWTGRRIA